MSEADLNRSQADGGAARSTGTTSSSKRKADDTTDADNEQQQQQAQPDADADQAPVKRKKTDANAAPVKSSTAAAPPKESIVTFKSNKLTLNQKNLRPSIRKQLATNAGIVAINTYLEDCTEPINSIPDDHLAIVATLAQESDKGIVELAKEIKEELAPSMGESQEEEGASASQLLTLAAVQSAIAAVATRENYGIVSTPTLREDAIPATLQIWRWEARDSAHLSPKLRDTLLKRRQERVEARAEALRLIAALPQDERVALFTVRKRGRDDVEAAAQQSSDAVLAMAADGADVSSDAAAAAPSKAKAARPEPIIILDGDDDDEEMTASGSTAKQATLSTPAKASSSSSTPAKSSSTSKKPRAKAPLSAEQLKKAQEKEERKRELERKRSEKAAKEAEKTAKLEKKKAVEAKQAAMMAMFAKRERSTSPSKAEIARKSDFDQVFVPIQYKDAAPINRFAKPPSANLISSIGANTAPVSALLLDFKTNAPQRNSAKSSRKGIHPPVSVREAMRLINEAGVMGGSAEADARRSIKDLADRRRVPVKLLQFDGDRRPAWFGTWTRSSNLVGPRKPLGQDPVALDYNYDSDFEWEEEGAVEGEEIADGDERDEDAATDDDGGSEMDDWLEDDLVEDVEEVEQGQPMDVDPDVIPCDARGNPLPGPPASAFARPSALTAPASLLAPNMLLAKKKKTKAPNKRKFNAKLVPFATGPHWELTLGTPAYENFAPYQIEFLNSARPGLNPFTWVEPDLPALLPDTATDVVTAAPSRPSKQTAAASESTGSSSSILPPAGGSSNANTEPVAPKRPFPEDQIPALLALAHGSTRSKALLVETAKEQFSGATKAAIEYALFQHLEPRKKNRDAWSVKSEYKALVGR